MGLNQVLNRIKEVNWKKHETRIRDLVQRKPLVIGAGVLGLLLVINLIGIGSSKESRIIERPSEVSFQNGRILNDRESTFYYGKEKLLSQKTQTMMESQARLEAKLAELEIKLQAATLPPAPSGTLTPVDGAAGPQISTVTLGEPGIQTFAPMESLEGSVIGSTSRGSARTGGRRESVGKGPDLIAFPVKSAAKTEGVMLPSGSYVKAKILTGVEVPEGKTYPVLMVLDFSYVGPNEHKVDLTGCFMIAKAEGDLSTERVQMQATKLSCVSKRGRMFERDVNGFVADDKDGSFALQGKVNSKQGRVASMAFLASVVDGVGKAVQAAQTTQSTNPLGGTSSTLSGDAGKYVVAGGASNAAGMVAGWYLQQAQNLAPTVQVGSGRDVWIVMKDKVNLPEEFFKKERNARDEGIYSYFTKLLD
ncbi:MAG: TraB/VirB10 family protein [Bdellovibrionales bacterium]|nr:TraB/VirB10 family protein [Bdellovibrionales bacterium]